MVRLPLFYICLNERERGRRERMTIVALTRTVAVDYSLKRIIRKGKY